MKPNSKLLVLLPLDHNKMVLHWRGKCDYLVKIFPGVQKLYHINLLREYISRQSDPPVLVAPAGIIAGQSAQDDDDVDRADRVNP